jgi:hypothetical protein
MCLMEIYHGSYNVQDKLELFMIHTRRIGGFIDFLIFKRHIMYP